MNEPFRLQILGSQDTSHLDADLLDEAGRLQVNPSTTYAAIPWDHLRLWTHQNAFYGLPTPELIECIREVIAGRSAIEVGAGNGCLGRALGIPLTDSKIQDRPEVAAYYHSIQQPTISYPSDVERLTAKAAVKKHRPKVIVGSWLTQFSDGSRPGSMFGIDEQWLLRRVKTYVMFGSIHIHQHKAIWPPTRIIQEPWMFSRAQDDSALFIWEP